MSQNTVNTMKNTLEKIKARLDPSFDWEAAYEDSHGDPVTIQELVSKIAKVIPESEMEAFHAANQRYECGSAAVLDTPKALYRALWLFKPAETDFSDMYKSRLFCIYSADERFGVMVEFYKYELGLYFSCPKECRGGTGSSVTCGFPGANNRVSCSDEVGQLFFEIIKGALEFEHTVYAGNDFQV